MADILPFKKPAPKKKKPGSINNKKTGDNKTGGSTLCLSGFHKWKIDNSTSFSVKEGKLLTRYICERCKKTKTETT